MMIYEILGQSNYAISIFLDILVRINHGPIQVTIVSNLPEDENHSLKYSYKTPGVTTKVLHYTKWKRTPESQLIVGSIGKGREVIYKMFEQHFNFPVTAFCQVIDPRANLPLVFKIGHGVHIAAGSTICPWTELGNFVVVNRNASVGHHVVLQDFVTINPGVTVAGLCYLERGAIVGAGATIIDGITIGKNSVVGAGSVVTRDVPESAVVVGSPARVIRRNI